MKLSDSPGLLDAMVAVQSEAPTLSKNKTNPHFGRTYAGLDVIVETIGPLLAKNDLVWMTKPTTNEHGQPALYYKIAHAPTREFEDGTMPLLLQKQDSQGMGSAITYARRYALCAVLNLVADDDDDGAANTNSAAAPQRTYSRDDGASDQQKKFLREILAGTARGIPKPSKPELEIIMKHKVPGVTLEDGWMDKLTRKQASDLLSGLKDDLRPSVEHPSDVPSELPLEVS